MNQDILIKVPFTGQIESFSPIGIGAYPYDCRTKDKYPQSMVYQNSTGGWVGSHDLKETPDGYFIIKGTRR